MAIHMLCVTENSCRGRDIATSPKTILQAIHNFHHNRHWQFHHVPVHPFTPIRAPPTNLRSRLSLPDLPSLRPTPQQPQEHTAPSSQSQTQSSNEAESNSDTAAAMRPSDFITTVGLWSYRRRACVYKSPDL